MIEFKAIQQAHERIKPHINETPVVTSNRLNHWLGHDIYFKAECLQKIGAFKSRGGCNAVQQLLQAYPNVKRIVANSSGNHAQAVAWAGAQFNIPVTIYMPSFASKVKAQATKTYGAQVVQLDTRQEVDQAVEEAAKQDGVFWIPPYNDDAVIAGQGTAALEALHQIDQPLDAVFAPCGGGGLISGTLVATRAIQRRSQVIAVEPEQADDAYQSFKSKQIKSLPDAPQTLADGAMTLSVGDKTFEHILQLNDFYTVTEESIAYWTQWLQHLLKMHVEPTSAMAMAGVHQWLQMNSLKQKVLVILSGGNIDAEMMKKVWATDYLTQRPSLY
jgi:threonine dehydratase